jgi:succinate dehydrogenase / fumarate reductase cytochrome b subunit
MTKKKAPIDKETLHKNRPLSPHISIYKPQLTSVLSILHRITGAYLYLGLIILAWTIFSFVYFPQILENIGEYIKSCMFFRIAFKAAILGWTFSLFYHQLNGIRHLFWDAGKGFEIKTAYRTGYLVVAFSILLTIACWLVALKTHPVFNPEIPETVIINIQE